MKNRLLAPLHCDAWLLTGHQVLQVVEAEERLRSDLAETGNG